MSDILAAMMSEGLVTLKRVAQDGMRVRASAGACSFRREPTLKQWRAEAATEVERLSRQIDAAEETKRKAAPASGRRGSGAAGWNRLSLN